MPETVKSLKKENDLLKSHIDRLREEFKNFQEATTKKLQNLPNDDMTVSSPPLNAETAKSLDFLSNEYHELTRFRVFAEKEFKRFNNCLEELTGHFNKIATAIDEMQKYSYQYNLKILGLPELSHQNEQESAVHSTNLCVRLFNEMGVEVKSHDIDIAHRIPSRNSLAGPRPIICKFVRRLVRNQIIAARKEASKVKPEAIDLPPNADLSRVLIVEHLTPNVQNLLFETKQYQKQHNFKFCWVRNFNIYLRKTEDSDQISIRCSRDLEKLTG